MKKSAEGIPYHNFTDVHYTTTTKSKSCYSIIHDFRRSTTTISTMYYNNHHMKKVPTNFFKSTLRYNSYQDVAMESSKNTTLTIMKISHVTYEKFCYTIPYLAEHCI